MKIRRAVITAASPAQRLLPLQTITDQDGSEKPVLRIILDEVHAADIDDICVIVSPGDQPAYAEAAKDRTIQFVAQDQPLGYAHALYCSREFVGDEPFLHLVGDHLYVGSNGTRAACHLVQVAESNACAVSAVQATRENFLPLYGTVGGHRLAGQPNLYRIETVIEKPTPTEAEQRLIISGLRSGYYLCFFGMHVLTPAVMDILHREWQDRKSRISLSGALGELASREQYLAVEQTSRRYDVGVKYGLLRAQLALALSGRERSEVLSELLEIVAASKPPVAHPTLADTIKQ